MKKIFKPLRLAGILLVLAIGFFAILGPVSPGAESVAHEQALIRSAAPYGAPANMPALSGDPDEGVMEATSVNLADVVYAPVSSMSERWEAGELDIDNRESIISPAERAVFVEAAKDIDFSEATAVNKTAIAEIRQNAPAQNSSLTVKSGFDALDVSDSASGGYNYPPDSDMAAGPNHLIAVENSSFEIYNKSGTSLAGPTLFDNFLSSVGGSNTFDPTVMYDSEEDRFVMGIEDGTKFFLMVTETSDPTGDWWLYSFDARSVGDDFFDYPHIGIGDHAIFVGANMFDANPPKNFRYGRVFAIDKNTAYTGASTTFNAENINTGGSPQPLNLTGFQQGTVPQPFDTHYFISNRDGETVDLWAWSDALGSGTPSIVQTHTLSAGGYPVDVPQKGSSNEIQANGWGLNGFEYRNGYGWTTGTISGAPAGMTINAIRSFSIELSGPFYTLTDEKISWYNDSFTFFPDIAVDHCGNVAVGYERSDSLRYPSLEYDGFVNTGGGTVDYDDTGFIKAGEAVYSSIEASPFRWGDYSGMAIDPDGRTFWYMGEYAKTVADYPDNNYGNYIARLSYGCGGADVDVTIGGTPMDTYPMASEESKVLRYSVDGAVETNSAKGELIIASLNQYRRLYSTGPYTGVTQTMALPDSNISNIYVMPRYDYSNPGQLYDAVLLANVDTVSRDITVTIGGTVMGTYTLAPSESVYKLYPGVADGPLVVSSSDVNAKIVASLYELRREKDGVGWNGQSEMMGLPSSQLSDKYLIPIYFGDPSHTALKPQVFIANADTVSRDITVKIGGASMGTYTLAPNTSQVLEYPIDGAVEISGVSGAKIIASLNQFRRLYGTGPYTGVTQTMAVPYSNISNIYVMPRYDYSNPDQLYDAVLLANVDTVSRDITVTIGGTVMGTYTLVPSESAYKLYPGVADGPLVVSSDGGAKIVASLYELRREKSGVGWNGQSEMMGLPSSQLSDKYLIPIYFGDPSHTALDPQVFIAVP